MKKLSFKKNKEGSNLSIGEATTETLPSRFLNDFFCRLSQAGVCSGDPVTQKILETTIGAVYGKRLA